MNVVVGLGAAGSGDDAVGVLIARQLAAEGFDAHATSDASALLEWFEQGRHVILVDAVAAPARVGEVLTLTASELAAECALVSSHGLAVRDVLSLGVALYGEAQVSIEIVGIAIDPRRCEPSELSAPVRAGMTRALALLRNQSVRGRAPTVSRVPL